MPFGWGEELEYDAGDMRRAKAEGAAEERAACAELVRAAGCVCVWLDKKVGHFVENGGSDGLGAWAINDDEHDLCCPRAILAAIEARGRG